MKRQFMKKAMGLLMIGGLVAFSSCSTTQRVDPRIFVTDGAADHIEVEGLVTRTNDNGFMEIQANLQSESSSLRKFRYKIQWKNLDGFPINSHQTRWVNFSVIEGAPHSIKFIAPTVEAEDFQILIEEQY